VGNYILDFYCASAKLAVELDGSQHYGDKVEYDKKRTDFINLLGIEVIRFANNDVYNYFESVCNEIDRKIIERMNNNPRHFVPPPSSEGGNNG